MTKTAQVSDENTHIFQVDKQSLFKYFFYVQQTPPKQKKNLCICMISHLFQ